MVNRLALLKGMTKGANTAYNKILMNKVIPLSATDDKILALLKVSPEHLNSNGTVHPGYITSLMDNFMVCAIATSETIPGITVDFTLKILKEIKLGTDVLIETKPVKIGKRISYLGCEFRDYKDESIVYAKGYQSLFMSS